MIRRLLLGAFALSLALCALPAAPAHAQGISQKVGVCDPLYAARCLKPATDGSIAVTGAAGASINVNMATIGGVAVTAPTALSPDPVYFPTTPTVNLGGSAPASGEYLSTQPTLSSTNVSPLLLDNRGNLKVTVMTTNATTSASIPAGANIIGKVGIDQTTAGTTNGVVTVGAKYAASGTTTTTASLTSATCSASFTPLAGRPFNVSISGTWVATVTLKRSFDAGATKLPLTVGGSPLAQWSGPASEVEEESEFGVAYYACADSYTSGTITVRLSQ